MNKEIYKDLFFDVGAEIAYWPYWWYSAGFKKALNFAKKQLKNAQYVLALGILIKNFFRPMYAERGFAAYLLSIMVRTWQIFWRTLALALWLILILAMLIVWLTILPYALWRIFFI